MLKEFLNLNSTNICAFLHIQLFVLFIISFLANKKKSEGNPLRKSSISYTKLISLNVFKTDNVSMGIRLFRIS